MSPEQLEELKAKREARRRQIEKQQEPEPEPPDPQPGFVCPDCLVPLRVIDTIRRTNSQVDRKRRCPACGLTWVTHEKAAFAAGETALKATNGVISAK